jgi:hypothetical protein
MPRNLQRLCLQDGISINLNRLLQRGSLVRNGRTVGAGIQWTSNVWGVVGTGTMSADMTGEQWGWFSIRMNGGADQHIQLKAQPRYFGGETMVLPLPIDAGPGLSPLAAEWSIPVRGTRSMGTAKGGLPVPVHGSGQPSTPCTVPDP